MSYVLTAWPKGRGGTNDRRLCEPQKFRSIRNADAGYFSSALPPDGTDVSVEVLLPALGGGTSRGLRLQSEGKVVRAEHREAATGFAVRCEFARVDGREPESAP